MYLAMWKAFLKINRQTDVRKSKKSSHSLSLYCFFFLCQVHTNTVYFWKPYDYVNYVTWPKSFVTTFWIYWRHIYNEKFLIWKNVMWVHRTCYKYVISHSELLFWDWKESVFPSTLCCFGSFSFHIRLYLSSLKPRPMVLQL